MQFHLPESHVIRRVLNAIEAGIACLALTACVTMHEDKPTKISTQDQAGPILITRDMVEPWSEVSDSLAPNFTMNGDLALTKVVPITERIQSSFVHAFGGGLAVGIPQSSSTSTNTTTSSLASSQGATDGVPTSTSTSGITKDNSSTSTSGPGVVPTLPSGAPAGASTPTGFSAAGDIGTNPLVQYRAAAFLNESVQLLNREVQNAALSDCMVPYVVKLRMAFMAKRPRLGYTLHTRIAFLGDESDPPKTPAEIATDAKAGTKPFSPAITTSADCAGTKNSPVIVPILASDDLQSAVKSNAEELAQQLNFALSFMVHGLGGAANLNRLDQSIRAVLNHDINSTMTVSLEADNIVYVKIAPSNLSSGQPSLEGRTYDVDLLVLVPRSAFDRKPQPVIHFDSYSELTDAESGVVVPPRPQIALAREFDRKLEPYLITDPERMTLWRKMPINQKVAAINRLLLPVEQAEYAQFAAIAACPLVDNGCPAGATIPDNEAPYSLNGYPGVLIPALSALSGGSPFQTGVLDLRRPTNFSFPAQDVLVQDDGKSGATALMYHFSGKSAMYLSGRLELYAYDGKTSGPKVIIPASGVTLNTLNGLLTLTFPSPAKYKVSKVDPANTANKLIFSVVCDAGRTLCPALDQATNGERATGVSLATTDTPAPALFSMISTSDNVVADKLGTGRSALLFDKVPPTDPITLSVAGAGVSAAVDNGGNPLKTSAGTYTVVGGGTVYLSMFNLVPGSTITVTAKTKTSGTATITLHPISGQDGDRP